jgi:hypothetical protein
MQSFIIGSRGKVNAVPYEKLCAKGTTGVPFKKYISIQGHFDNTCANYQVRSWRSMCDHNPKSKKPQVPEAALNTIQQANVPPGAASNAADPAPAQAPGRRKRPDYSHIVTGLEDSGTPPPRVPTMPYHRPPLFGYTQREVDEQEAEWAEEQARREEYPDTVRLKIEVQEDDEPGLRLIHPRGIEDLTMPKRRHEIGRDRIVDPRRSASPVPPSPEAPGAPVARLTASLSAVSVSSGEIETAEQAARMTQLQAEQEAKLAKTKAKLQRYHDRRDKQ